MIELMPNGVRVVRRLQRPPADVFDAWVNPERLRAWFGPAGASVLSVEGELGVGHAYRLRVGHEDGRVDELVWSFREISPPERLVFGWTVATAPPAAAGETLVTITFRDRGAFTEVELEHTGVASDAQREMFASGWEACFAGLEATLYHLV